EAVATTFSKFIPILEGMLQKAEARELSIRRLESEALKTVGDHTDRNPPHDPLPLPVFYDYNRLKQKRTVDTGKMRGVAKGSGGGKRRKVVTGPLAASGDQGSK